MKRHTLIFYALLAASCQQDLLYEPDEAILGEREVVLHTEIVPTQENTRTWLDSESGGSPLQVYWSDGDRINVNGQTSAALAVSPGEKKRDADFSLRSVEAPFRVVYPASLVQDESYAADGSIGIRFPDTQAYTAGSFASGAAVLYGYAESGSVRLNNLTAAIRVRLASTNDTPLFCARLSCSSAKVCGNFTFNPQDGTLEAKDDEGGHTLTLAAEGVVLTAAGTDLYFTVPKGLYSSGLVFSFVQQSDRRAMQLTWTPSDPLLAGTLYCFDKVDFVPGAKEIETADEWNEFALAFNSGDDLSKYLFNGTTVRLGADITADNLTKIGSKTAPFRYELDGQDHTLTRNAATGALFSNIFGKVSHLNLAGRLDGSGTIAALCDTLYGGASLSNITSTMSVNGTVGGSGCSPSGLVCVARGGTMDDCVNAGAVTATLDCSSTNYNCQASGIIGQVNILQEPLTLNGCRNSGAITVNVANNGTSNGAGYAGMGGIIAWVRSNSYLVTLNDCDNSGALTWNKPDAAGAKKQTSVGGIIGIGAPINASTMLAPSGTNGMLLALKDCDNSGLVTCKALSSSASGESRQKVYIGGLAGSLLGQENTPVVVDHCTSTAPIVPYDITSDAPYYDATASQRAAFCAVMGGISGWSGYISISNGTTVGSSCVIGSVNRQVVAVAGAFGFAVRKFSITDSYIFCKGYFNRDTGYKLNRAVVAVVPVQYNTTAMETVPDIAGSTLTNCHLGGSLATNSSTFAYTTTTCLSSNTTLFNSESKTQSNLVYGQGCSTVETDVTVTGYTYWNGQN